MTIKELIKYAEINNLKDWIDIMVGTATEMEAYEKAHYINRGGIENQIDYLLKSKSIEGLERDLRDRVEEMLEEKELENDD